MISTWFYMLAPLWAVERVTRCMNPLLIVTANEMRGVRVWKQKDGTEIWICRTKKESTHA